MVKGPHWLVKGPHWLVKDRHWLVNDRHWLVKDRRWLVKGRRWLVKGHLFLKHLRQRSALDSWLVHYLAFCSGGTNYTVTGQNLDIVQEPRLIVYVSVPQNVAKRQAQGSQEVELLSDVSLLLTYAQDYSGLFMQFSSPMF